MNKVNMMTLSVIGLDVFAREIQHEGVIYKVQSAGVGDSFEELDRVKSLLRTLVFDHDIDAKILNEIGFSKEDASNLGLSVDDLENINIPPRSEWNE